MPFTLAHPAAILPLPRLLRKWSVPSALVIGSMSPDFAFFLPLGVTRLQSHSLAGIFWFCLPVGLASYLTFHLLLKRPLLSLPPGWISRRLSHIVGTSRLPNVSWLAVAASLMVGTLTHLAWDSFTHPGAPGVEAIPFLRMEVFTIDTYHAYVYKLLQYFSSGFGLLILAIWSYLWLRKAPVGQSPAAPMTDAARLRSVAAILSLPCLSGLVTAAFYFPNPFTVRGVELLLGMGAISVFSALGLALILFGAWWHLRFTAGMIQTKLLMNRIKKAGEHENDQPTINLSPPDRHFGILQWSYANPGIDGKDCASHSIYPNPHNQNCNTYRREYSIAYFHATCYNLSTGIRFFPASRRT